MTNPLDIPIHVQIFITPYRCMCDQPAWLLWTGTNYKEFHPVLGCTYVALPLHICLFIFRLCVLLGFEATCTMNHHNRRGNETGVSSYDFHIPCWCWQPASSHPQGSQARGQASLYQLLQISPLYEAFSPSIQIYRYIYTPTLELSTHSINVRVEVVTWRMWVIKLISLFIFCYLRFDFFIHSD